MKRSLIIVEGFEDKKFIQSLLISESSETLLVEEIFKNKDKNYQKDILFLESLLADFKIKKAVESDSSVKKLENLLSKILSNFEVKEITERGGKAAFSSQSIKTLLLEFIKKDPNQSPPDNVLLICDADFEETNERLTGFKKTKKFLEKLIKELLEEESFWDRYPKIIFDFFILPSHADDGNLDSLFLQCATTQIVKKIKCVDDYLKCLGQEPRINKRDKLRAQLLISAIGHQKKFKTTGDVVQEGVGYWNLDHTSLLPLKTFLKKFK